MTTEANHPVGIEKRGRVRNLNVQVEIRRPDGTIREKRIEVMKRKVD
jgi:hypothetical protein